MLKHRIIRAASLLCVLVAAASAFGQVGLDASYPYKGVINGTRVRVRAGRGDPSGANNFYYCASLSSPAKVTVVGARNGWLAVLPPEGCYSVVLESAVKANADGTKGVTIKATQPRAAGVLRTAQFTAGQRVLAAGTTVEIIGKAFDRVRYYKIKTPPNVQFWIYATFVDKVGAVPVAPPKRVVGVAPTTRPTGVSPTTRPATVGKTPVAPPTTGAIDAQLREFRDVQAALKAEYTKPVLERDYPGLIDKFKALKLEADNPLVPFVNYYVKFIQGDMDRLASLEAARKLSTEAADAQAEYEAARRNVVVKIAPKPLTFDASGIIVESRMFAGMSAVRKRYIVYNKRTQRLNAYIYASDPKVNLAGLVGKHVGVYGDKKFDAGLGANLVDVKVVEIIDDKTTVPVLSKPIVRAMPVKPKPPVVVKPVSPTTRPKPAAPGNGVVKPIPLIDLVPPTKPTGVSKPAPVVVPDAVKPAPIIRPIPIPVPKPKSVGTVAPAPKPVAVKPKAVDVASPKPNPVVAPMPKPIPVVKPKPVAVVSPKPVTVVKPKPIVLPKPNPIVVVKPKPISMPKPNPIAVAKPKPIKPVGVVPLPVAKPKPIDLAKPIISPKAIPLPTTRPAPMATTRPAVLIDLESMTPRPTTRPATGIDAIPAPTKAVDPDDFPMPLPPSGLPLLDVKKAPTTRPIDESEFE
jgi:hypothetical protein